MCIFALFDYVACTRAGVSTQHIHIFGQLIAIEKRGKSTANPKKVLGLLKMCEKTHSETKKNM